MIFVTGPLFSGKQTFVCEHFGWTEADFQTYAVRDVQELAAKYDDLSELAGKLSEKAVVIATETGGGIVPVDPVQRRNRERAGRLACLLAEHAETVIRVCCGIPQVLKGQLP